MQGSSQREMAVGLRFLNDRVTADIRDLLSVLTPAQTEWRPSEGGCRWPSSPRGECSRPGSGSRVRKPARRSERNSCGCRVRLAI